MELVPGPLPSYVASVTALADALLPFFDTLAEDGAHAETLVELDQATQTFTEDVDRLQDVVATATLPRSLNWIGRTSALGRWRGLSERRLKERRLDVPPRLIWRR